MKTYMNWFLSGGVVLSLAVVTLLFNKLSALDGRLAAMEMALPAPSVTAAAGSLSGQANARAPNAGTANSGWGDMNTAHPFSSLGINTDDATAVEQLLENVPAAFDIQDPRFQEKLTDMVAQKQRQREQERRSNARARWQEDMRDEVGSFASEMGIEDMESDIISVFEDVDTQRQDILGLIEEGGISQIDARTEMRMIHHEMEDELREMLGDDDYEALIRTVPMGPRPMR